MLFVDLLFVWGPGGGGWVFLLCVFVFFFCFFFFFCVCVCVCVVCWGGGGGFKAQGCGDSAAPDSMAETETPQALGDAWLCKVPGNDGVPRTRAYDGPSVWLLWGSW